MILLCPSCRIHKFQDKKYGKNMRVHNPCKPKDKGSHWRCTVCRNEKSLSSNET